MGGGGRARLKRAAKARTIRALPAKPFPAAPKLRFRKRFSDGLKTR
ncbi:hypothetical protein HMPREF9123_0413 [Neisseria bacilliformis ATCC BAA-1200]|uniref:Uncharacterized protein n=1 Tax=Neisseria bacilliformis ATCC BAA-1200 TaxID=888742 RepID=F2B9G7_9NEIS|nr:hypothetical protein HMPREF9123_0413 [Neisseria bacilliformis ATCC BAA-1200]